MTKFDECLQALAQVGEITNVSLSKIAKELNSGVNDNLSRLRKNFPGYSEAEIQKMAHEIAVMDLESRFKQIQLEEFHNVKARQKALEFMQTHWTGSLEAGLAERINLADRGTIGVFGMLANGPMQPLVQAFKRAPFSMNTWFNSPMTGENILKELLKVDSKDPYSKAFAEGYQNSLKLFEDAFKRAGYDFPKVDPYDFAHVYSYNKVLATSKKEFVDTLLPKLNWAQTKEGRFQGKNALEDRVAYLEAVYDDMRKEFVGAEQPKDFTSPSLNRIQRRMARKFVFNTPQDWIDVHKKYGEGNIYSNMLSELHNLAREYSIFSHFGPDSTANFKYLAKIAAGDKTKRKLAGRGGKVVLDPMTKIEKHWDTLTGKTAQIESKPIANTAATIRNITGMAKLGGAMLTAINDSANMRTFAKLYGISFLKLFGMHLKAFANMEDAVMVKNAMRTSTALEDLNTFANIANRFDELPIAGNASRISGQLLGDMLQVTGLTRWTKTGKQVIARALSSEYADMADLSFERLPQIHKQSLGMYGITPHIWDIARTSTYEILDSSGKVVDEAIDPIKMWKKDPDAAVAWQAYISEAARMGVKEPSIEVRATTTQGLRAGNWARELLSFPLQFKTFMLTHTIDNLRHILYDPRVSNRYALGTNFALYSLFLGGLSTVMQDMVKGERHDAEYYTSFEFVARAFAQAALLGPMTDIYYSMGKYANTQGNAKDLAESWLYNIMGPSTEFTVGGIANLYKLAEYGINPTGSTKNAPSDAVRWLRRNTPGTNVWYTKYLLHKYMWDRMERWADPKRYDKKMARAAKLKGK